MLGLNAWRKTAAGITFSVLAAGVSLADELPPGPAYDLLPIPADTSLSRSNGNPVAVIGIPSQASPVSAEYCGTWWERYQFRKWEKKRRLQEKFLGYPEEFQEPPQGLSLYGQMNAQIANGAAAKLVLYQFDFMANSPQLNSKGQERLARHIAAMNSNNFPLVIEQTPEIPALAESRRTSVQQELLQAQSTVSLDRIVVGTPAAISLPGRQAILLDLNLLRDTRNGGTTNLAPGSFRAGAAIQGMGNSGNSGMNSGGTGGGGTGFAR